MSVDRAALARTLLTPSFAQFDSGRQGQLSHLDLQRLLAKDGTVDSREDCVKMVSPPRVQPLTASS